MDFPEIEVLGIRKSILRLWKTVLRRLWSLLKTLEQYKNYGRLWDTITPK